jgi:hypothetical protein
MSDRISIPTVVVYDRRLQPNAPVRVIKRDANATDFDVTPATGQISSTSRQEFKVIISDQLISRRIEVRARDVTIDFSVAANAGNDTNLKVLNQGFDALRPFPLARNMSAIQARLNGLVVDTVPQQNVQVYMLTGNEHSLFAGTNSLTPTRLDNCQDFSGIQDVISTALNPLGLGDGFQAGRGAFPMQVVSNQALSVGAAATAQVVIPWIQEPLLLPMCYWGSLDEADGFRNIINDMIITISWMPNMQYQMWTHATPTGMAGAFSVTGFSWAGVDLITYKFNIPPSFGPKAQVRTSPQYYPNPRFELASQSVGAIAGTSSASVPIQNFSFSGMPHIFYLYLAESVDTLYSPTGYSLPDRRVAIDSLTIKANGITGKLNGASPQHLYELAVRNGVDLSWADFYPQAGNTRGALYAGSSWLGSGTFLAFTPGDLGVEDGWAPGVSEKVNFSGTIYFTNPSATAYTDLTIYLFALYDGYVRLDSNGTGVQSELIVTKDEVLTSGNLPQLEDVDMSKAIGGNIFDKARGYFTRAEPILRTGAKVVKTAGKLGLLGPQGFAAATALDLLGAGNGEKEGDYECEDDASKKLAKLDVVDRLRRRRM